MPDSPRSTSPAVAELVMGFVAALRLPAGGLAARARAADVARDLLDRWAEPHRRYHTVAHLTATLEAVRMLLSDPGTDPGAGPVPTGTTTPDRADLELAVWFHDAVHAGRPGDDEEASARLAETRLADLGLPAERIAEVARLVRLTATHRPAPDDLAGQLLCDADLSVLGAAVPAYLDYTRAVRQEYAHVPDADFRAGRAAVLARLGEAPELYASRRARRLWEASARANLSAELARLADPAVPLPGLTGPQSGTGPPDGSGVVPVSAGAAAPPAG